MGTRRCKHVSPRTRVVAGILTEDPAGWAVEGACEFGMCQTWSCPVCGCAKYGGVFLGECPCDDDTYHPGMRRRPPAPVKTSLPTHGRRRRRRRPR